MARVRTVGDVERIKEVAKKIKALEKDGVITFEEMADLLDILYRA